MRVAMIGCYWESHEIPTAPDRVGLWLAKYLLQHYGVEFHYVCLSPRHSQTTEFEREGIIFHVVPCAGIVPFSISQYFKAAKSTAQKLCKISPDIVHAQNAVWGLPSLSEQLPTVMTIHGIFHREANLRRGLSRLITPLHLHFYYKMLKQAKYIFSISPYAKQELSRFTNAEFIDMPNPINDKFFKLSTDRSQQGRLLFVGHLNKRKNILGLLAAFAKAFRANNSAHLRLVGGISDKSYENKIRQFIQKTGLHAAVDIVGPLDGKTLYEEFELAEAFVLMSKQETAPLVVAEAMAAGKVVVANRICGVPYMVENGVTGFLVENGDTDGFARSVLNLLENSEKRKDMGKAAREKANQYRLQRVAQGTLESYHRIIREW